MDRQPPNVGRVVPLPQPAVLGHRRRAKWEHLLSIAYLSHLLLDLPSHTGIWGMAPFWPYPMLVNGWFDAWAWGPGTIFTYALIPAALWALARAMDVSGWWTKDSTATQAS